jgi:very-short-patch-repair endonuclease
MEIAQWLENGSVGIAHRDLALRAGFTASAVRKAARDGRVKVIRRSWVSLPEATGDLVEAAAAGALVACVSAARHRGWWLPEGVDPRLHLRFPPHARGSAVDGVAHWTKAIAPTAATALVESPEDAMAHIATCFDRETALVVWESAIRREGISVDALRGIRWPSRAAAACSERVNGLSDSGLETIFVHRLSGWGLLIRQQIFVAGRPVDVLIGERLVVQIDGYAFHSSSSQRTRDVAHDAELRFRGYTVLRFTYAQVIHDWPSVERAISRAIAIGAHLAA